MKVFGLAGWSGSGKTTLMTGLLRELTGRGLRVSTIKHAHHDFDIDYPGKDSHRHRQAGACEVMVASSRRWALIHELREEDEPSRDALLAHLAPVDLVLIEGFKAGAHDKLEVRDPDGKRPALAPSDPHIVAVAGARGDSDPGLPRFSRDDVSGIADFIVDHCRLGPAHERPERGRYEHGTA